PPGDRTGQVLSARGPRDQQPSRPPNGADPGLGRAEAARPESPSHAEGARGAPAARSRVALHEEHALAGREAHRAGVPGGTPALGFSGPQARSRIHLRRRFQPAPPALGRPAHLPPAPPPSPPAPPPPPPP